MTASSPKVTKGGFLRRNNLKLPAIGGSSSNGNGNGGGKHAKGNAIVTTATNSKEEGYGSTGTNGSTDDGRVSLNSPKASTSIESLPLSELFLSSKGPSSTISSAFSLSPSVSRDSAVAGGGPNSTAYANYSDRRGSVISTYSLSQSAASNSYNHPNSSYLNYHRASLSSFASSTGSPRAAASSNGTTIGDLSMIDVPLIRHHNQQQQHNSRSRGSFYNNSEDGSSVHSYPPRPRERTRSIASSYNEGSGGKGTIDWKWSGFQSGKRDYYRDETLPPNHPAPVPRPAHIPLTSPPNPFAPLRKRLMRTINTGKRVVVVEVQLILELVDALENYIKSIESSCTTTASSNSTSGSIKSFTEAGSGASSTPVNSMPESSSNLLSEVLSLVKELCEIAPEVQRCLSQGQYGPLAHQPPRAPPMPESLSMALRSSNWWPRRLSRDCRGLLEEVGLSPPGGGSNNRANSNSHHQGNVVLLSPTLALVQGNIVPVPAVTNGVGGQLRPNISLCPNLVSGAIVGGGGENIGLAVGEEAKNSEWSETRVAAIQAVQTEDLQALAARRSARQAELLNEGKRRWAAYRQRQQSGDLGESALVEGME